MDSFVTPRNNDTKLKVAVFYGGDAATGPRDALLAWLRGPGVDVDARIASNMIPHSAGSIDDRVTALIEWADACIAMLTPDPRSPHGAPNVIDEIGRWRGGGRADKLCILRQASVESPTNRDGLIWVAFESRVKEAFGELHRFLNSVEAARRAIHVGRGVVVPNLGMGIQPVILESAIPELQLKSLRDERKRLRRLAPEERIEGTQAHARLEELTAQLGGLEKQLERDRVDDTYKKHVLKERYSFYEELGEGSSGKVWRCYDNEQEQEIAIKILHPHLHHKYESRARIYREAKYMRQLMGKSPHFLTLYDNNTEYPKHPILHFTMELVPNGTTIVEAAKKGHLGFALRLFLQTCDAMKVAHEVNICHRDLKPANVLVSMRDKPTVKICDLGLARANDTVHLSSSSKFMGSFGYAAPEPSKGGFEPLRDVYSLGMILYTLVTGQYIPSYPLTKDKMVQAIMQSTLRTADPRRFTRIFLKATAEEPAARYPTVEALAKDVEALLSYVPSESDEKKSAVSVAAELVRFCDELGPGISLVTNVKRSLSESVAHMVLHWSISNATVCVFDFAGELVDRVSPHFPRAITSRVILVNPCDTEWAVGTNPLALATDANRERTVKALVHALELPMDVALREGERILLSSALRLLTYSSTPVSVYALDAFLRDRSYRQRLMREAGRNEQRAVGAINQNLREKFISAHAARVSQVVSQLFTNGMFTDLVSQPQPKSSLLHSIFQENRIGLFDFRSDQLTPKHYACLFLMHWLEYELSQPAEQDAIVLIYGAEKMDASCWELLERLPASLQVILVSNGPLPKFAREVGTSRYERLVVHAKHAHQFDPNLTTPAESKNYSVLVREREHVTVFDEHQLRLTFADNYSAADLSKVIEKSRERTAVRRDILRENQARFVDAANPELSLSQSIGPELSELLTMPNIVGPARKLIAAIAFKTRYVSLADNFLDSVIKGSELDLGACALGVQFHTYAAQYDKAFDYAVRGIRRAATLERPLTAEECDQLLHLLRAGFKILVRELGNATGVDAEFLKAASEQFVPMSWPSPQDPKYLVLRAQARLTNDAEGSRRDWNDAIALDPTHTSVNAYGTWLKDRERDYQRAEEAYRDGLARFPKSALLMHNLAQLLITTPATDHDDLQRRVNEADALVTKALKLDALTPLHPHILATAGDIQQRKTRLKAAESAAANLKESQRDNQTLGTPETIPPRDDSMQVLSADENQASAERARLAVIRRTTKSTQSTNASNADVDASTSSPVDTAAAQKNDTNALAMQNDKPSTRSEAHAMPIASAKKESPLRAQAKPEAPLSMDARYAIGNIVTARITVVGGWGAFATVDGCQGTIFVTEFPSTGKSPQQVVFPGYEVQVKIIGHMERGTKLELSIKQALAGAGSKSRKS